MAAEEVIVWILRAVSIGILGWCAIILSRPNLPKE